MMKKYYLFEIEADERPIYNIGEWEKLSNLTKETKYAEDLTVIAYGEIEDGKYIELFRRT